jgi:ABC-type multidrug transport system fused ATPase/permease subunit
MADQSPRRTIQMLVTYLGPQRRKATLLGVLLLASIGLQLANPLNMAAFLDAATTGAPYERLLMIAGLFLGLALVQQAVAIGTAYIGEDVGWTATNQLRLDLARHCLGLDLSFHSARTPGELIERIDGDVAALSNFFSQFVVQIFGNALLMVGVLIFMFVQDWRIGLALLTFVLITLLAISRVRTIATPYWKAQRQASAEMFGFLEERIGGTEEIRANGARGYVMQRFEELLRTAGRRELKAGLVSSVTINVAWLLFASGNALALLVSAALLVRGELTIGAAYLIFYYTNLLTRPMERLMEQLEDAQRALASIGRAQTLLDTQTRLPAGTGLQLPAGPLSVAFENVSFMYVDEVRGAEAQDQRPRTEEHGASGLRAKEPGTESPEPTINDQPRPAASQTTNHQLPATLHQLPSTQVLHNLSFALRPGTTLGLLGRTGSGKTTLARLLVRLYDTQQGAVRVGGVDVRDTELIELRRNVALVTQQVQLFRATLRDNLTFFNPCVPDEQIIAILSELGLERWYAALPMGLDTMLAPGDAGVSAGEGQLLAFARVFLRDPGLVILDEASSRLDPATEQLLVRAVERLVQNRTAIIIAHRLGTVQRCDEIMILEQGQIREHGPRIELAADPGSRFAELLRTGMEEVLS